MAYTTPTVGDFKSQFSRDFPFAVPAFGASGRINLSGGELLSVDLLTGGRGYAKAPTVEVRDSVGAGAEVTATVSAGSVATFVVVDGGAGYVAPTLKITGGAGDETDDTRVTDADIEGALLDAGFNVNGSLFSTQERFVRAFGFLAAHNLVERLRAAGEGVRSQYSWLPQAIAVGDVSKSSAIPEKIMRNPFLASLSTTRYGARYLEIVSPLLVGNMQAFHRRTLP